MISRPTRPFAILISLLLVALHGLGCRSTNTLARGNDRALPYVLVLGIAQDGGYPQAACRKPCCEPAWRDPRLRRLVTSLAIVDPQSGERWLIEATPDLREQLRLLDDVAGPASSPGRTGLSGIFVTHAHIGHYSGLQTLGREAVGDDAVPVYAMPRMRAFLRSGGPWSLLVDEQHIDLLALKHNEPVQLNSRISVTPFLVPHRDEFSETVGFRIKGPARSILFIPDIDKWERWESRIEDEILKHDIALLDGTFFADGEIPGRDISEIPHPFIEESMNRFGALTAHQRARIRFIHLNHTNPAIDATSPAAHRVKRAGFGLAEQGERFSLGD